MAILLVFTGTTLYGIYRMDSIRQDLRLTSQGYLQLTRALTQVKTIAESKDAYVERAMAESDPRVRQYLVRYARDFYPRVLRERLAELAAAAHRLAAQELPQADARFTQDIAGRLDRAVELNASAEEAASAFFEQVADPLLSPDPQVVALQRERAEALAREIKLISLNLDNKIAQGVLRAEVKERNAVWAVVGLGVTVIVIGLIITLLMTRALRPLGRLTEAAYAISRGGFDVQIPIERQDEIGTLATAFNEMAQGLKDREEVLARRSAEVERLNAFLESVLHSVSTGVVVCSRERVVTVINRAGRRLLGYTLVDPVGKPLAELPLGDLLAEHDSALQAILENAPDLRLEGLPLRPPGGPALLLDLRVLPFRQPDTPHGVGGLVVLLDDVSEREHTRERLLQSERLAAMGRLAAQVAHEIRNPLSSIGLNCELLGDELEDRNQTSTEIQRLLRAISQEIDRLAELTEGYLRYARLPDADKRPSDMGALIRDLADFVRADFERRGLALDVEIATSVPSVAVDPSRIRLALLNLLRNAADASQQGQRVRVSLTVGSSALKVAVEDQGSGVTSDNVARLFEPFFSTKDSGTGLGLSVTRDVAVEHGGTAGYEPRPDGGSRFFIRIPAPEA